MDPPMYGINQDRSNNYGGIDRRDRVTRATALSMITDLMLNEHMHPSETVDLFEDLEDTCRNDGVSLPELLAENMYTGGVPPLMWEIQRCNWRESPELLMFLATNTPRSKVPWMIRTACQAVGDNELLQLLRETIEPDILCHVTSRLVPDSGEFITLRLTFGRIFSFVPVTSNSASLPLSGT